MKYKAGDRVVVRPDLTEGVVYHMTGDGDVEEEAVGDMLNYAGKTVTILDASKWGYAIEECGWNWTDAMFEGLVEIPSDVSIDISAFL